MIQKVFISSTYDDLKPYRHKVWDYLDKLNIKILGMEKFGARKSSPLTTCLEEVANSDIFISIVAFRYGSVENQSKKSFSQLEYEKAILLNKELMVYLMDDNAFIKACHVDTGIAAKRLSNFKSILKKHTIDTFKEPEELASKICERLGVLVPNLNKLIIRPKVLDCKLTRFNFHEEKWIAFVGYLMDKPYEIFTGLADEEIFPIPKNVNKGKIIKLVEENGYTRYDFQYTDKYGYKKTMGGLSHMFTKHTNKYGIIITKLLQKNVDVKELKEVIDEMDIFNDFVSIEWKQGVKKALGII